MQIDLECAKLTFDAPTPSGAMRWCASVYGGANARPQLESIAGGIEILIATPGRLNDFLDRKLVSLERASFFVLDEADRMHDMGSEPQIRRIIEDAGMLPSETRQMLMFSATFPKAIQKLAAQYLRSGFVKVSVGQVGASLKAISQHLVKSGASRREKFDLLLTLLRSKERSIVFCQQKFLATWIRQELENEWRSKGIRMKVAEIHADRTQGQRQTALRSFRK